MLKPRSGVSNVVNSLYMHTLYPITYTVTYKALCLLVWGQASVTGYKCRTVPEIPRQLEPALLPCSSSSRSMCSVCTTVTRSLKCNEWLAVWHVNTLGSVLTLWYALDSSIQTSVPGFVNCLMKCSSVITSLCATACTTPHAGVWDVYKVKHPHEWSRQTSVMMLKKIFN